MTKTLHALACVLAIIVGIFNGILWEMVNG